MNDAHSYDPELWEGIIQDYAQSEIKEEHPYAPFQTGFLSLDLALGGGLAPGLTEVYGPPSSGKTALLLQCLAHAQSQNKPAGLFTTETVDPHYYENLGVDLDRLPVLTNLDQVRSFLSTFPVALLVVDSLSALISNPQLENADMILFDFVYEIYNMLRPKQCVVLSSHIRNQTSIDPRKKYSGRVRSASWQMRSLFDVRMRIGRVNVSPPKYTQTIEIEANTLAPPGAGVSLDSRMGYGADRFRDLIVCSEAMGALVKKGTYYYLDELRLGPGIQNAASALHQDREAEQRLLQRVRDKLKEG